MSKSHLDASDMLKEDTRKVLQDFLAPELRAISARLDALEKRFDGRFEQVDGRFEQVEKRFEHIEKRLDRIEQRMDDADRRAERRHDEVMIGIRQVIDLNSIQQRLARLESKEAAHQ